MRENRLRWFGHVKCRPLGTPVMKSNNITTNGNARGRGRSKLTWPKTIKNDLIACSLSDDLALDRLEWRKRIHVADPRKWDKGLVFCCCCFPPKYI